MGHVILNPVKRWLMKRFSKFNYVRECGDVSRPNQVTLDDNEVRNYTRGLCPGNITRILVRSLDTVADPRNEAGTTMKTPRWGRFYTYFQHLKNCMCRDKVSRQKWGLSACVALSGILEQQESFIWNLRQARPTKHTTLAHTSERNAGAKCTSKLLPVAAMIKGFSCVYCSIGEGNNYTRKHLYTLKVEEK